MAKARDGKIISPEPAQETEMSESYISIGLGLLVVVVVGILLYNYFTQKRTATPPPTEEQLTEEATTSAQPGTTYKVQTGDTLWSIAIKSYEDGFKWPEIAKANNLTGDEPLETGQELKIPELPKAQASPADVVVSPSPKASPVAAASPEDSPATTTVTPPPTITGTSYTIVRGDTLWDIACRAYGDCYAWPKIYQANLDTISDPDLIFAGNNLNLPR